MTPNMCLARTAEISPLGRGGGKSEGRGAEQFRHAKFTDLPVHNKTSATQYANLC